MHAEQRSSRKQGLKNSRGVYVEAARQGPNQPQVRVLIRRTHYLLHHYDIIKWPYTIRGSP